ncbi:MAG: hypothetical protein K0R82_2011, partial [Flavipsychrobacter sp.]|nr:hypothetical protein [Flavipsychrobacter sp.]
YRYVFNMNASEDIDVMFYNQGIKAYHYCPDPNMLQTLKRHRIPVATFKSHNEYGVSKEICSYPWLHIINVALY